MADGDQGGFTLIDVSDLTLDEAVDKVVEAFEKMGYEVEDGDED